MTRVGCRHEAPASCVKGRSHANGRASHAAPLSATTTSAACAPAVKRGSDLYHLHGDHLGSTSLTTRGSTVEASRTYYAYGAERSASAVLQTDRTFTGQKSDATGLMYYNARDYDSALGTFILPDTIVSDAARVIHFNRFLYAGGNPLKYIDPSGRDFICVKGGPAFQNDGVTALITMCQQAANEAGWNAEDHGPI